MRRTLQRLLGEAVAAELQLHHGGRGHQHQRHGALFCHRARRGRRRSAAGTPALETFRRALEQRVPDPGEDDRARRRGRHETGGGADRGAPGRRRRRAGRPRPWPRRRWSRRRCSVRTSTGAGSWRLWAGPGARFDPDAVELFVDERAGGAARREAGLRAEAAANRRLRRREFALVAVPARRPRGPRGLWTTDLSEAYVRINAGYRT